MNPGQRQTTRGKICVSIANKTAEEAIAAAVAVEADADVIEIRLDALSNPVIQPFLTALSKPLLFTNRAAWEGGSCKSNEDKRVELLIEAANSGAAYVDIELRTDQKHQDKLLAEAQKSGTRTIISWHDFSHTPSTQELISIFQLQYRSGADIGKIVTTAHVFQDVLRVLDLQTEAADMQFPLIAFCMGRAGMISRIATLELGGFMSYGAPVSGHKTAPGQLPVSAIHDIMRHIENAD